MQYKNYFLRLFFVGVITLTTGCGDQKNEDINPGSNAKQDGTQDPKQESKKSSKDLLKERKAQEKTLTDLLVKLAKIYPLKQEDRKKINTILNKKANWKLEEIKIVIAFGLNEALAKITKGKLEKLSGLENLSITIEKFRKKLKDVRKKEDRNKQNAIGRLIQTALEALHATEQDIPKAIEALREAYQS